MSSQALTVALAGNVWCARTMHSEVQRKVHQVRAVPARGPHVLQLAGGERLSANKQGSQRPYCNRGTPSQRTKWSILW